MVGKNPFEHVSEGDVVHAARVGFAITPSDSAELSQFTRGIYIGTGGDLRVTFIDSGTITLKGLSAGVIYPFGVKKVHSTGTTAADLIGLA